MNGFQNDIISSIKIMTASASSKAGYDKTVTGIIQEVLKNGTCTVNIKNIKYENVPIYGQQELLTKGDLVKVVIPHAQGSQMVVIAPFRLGKDWIIKLGDVGASGEQNLDIVYKPTGEIPISLLAGGKGVRFFNEAENEGFWVNNIDYTISDDEYTELTALMGGGSQTS